MQPIISKYIAILLIIVCCLTISSQNVIGFNFSELNSKERSISLYENDADDEFNVGITVEGKKDIAFDLKVLFDNDFANDFETYSLKDFFVLDFSLVKSIGSLDIILSIENAINYGDSEVTIEPVLAQNNMSTYLNGFEHEAGFVAMLGISYSF